MKRRLHKNGEKRKNNSVEVKEIDIFFKEKILESIFGTDKLVTV